MWRGWAALFAVLIACGGDVPPDDVDGTDCRTAGASCALAMGVDVEVAERFICLRVDSDGGECFERCAHANGRSTCPGDEVCVEPVLHPQTAICRPSDCSDWREGPLQCDGGSCVEVAPGAGRCQTAGVIPLGQICAESADQTGELCAPQLYCEPTSGRCRRLCDLFGPDCEVGTACAYLTEGQGVCTPAIGGAAFESCRTEGAWCTHATRCLPFEIGGGSQLLCAPYCRSDADDCGDVRYQGLPTSCDASVFDDTVTIGLCLPQPG